MSAFLFDFYYFYIIINIKKIFLLRNCYETLFTFLYYACNVNRLIAQMVSALDFDSSYDGSIPSQPVLSF